MALAAKKGSLLSVKFGHIQTYTVGTAAVIWEGAVVCIRLADGLLYPVEEDTDDSLRQLVVGYALEDGIAEEEVRIREDGKFRLAFVGGTPVVGTLAMVYDDETVQAFDSGDSVQNIVVGRISELVGNDIYVDMLIRPSRVASSQYD